MNIYEDNKLLDFDSVKFTNFSDRLYQIRKDMKLVEIEMTPIGIFKGQKDLLDKAFNITYHELYGWQ